MRNHAFTAAILPLALVSALVLGANFSRASVLQQGTPVSSAGSGVTTEVLGQLDPAAAPGQALFLLRVTFAPGGAVTAHVHPGATIDHLAAGALQFELLERFSQ